MNPQFARQGRSDQFVSRETGVKEGAFAQSFAAHVFRLYKLSLGKCPPKHRLFPISHSPNILTCRILIYGSDIDGNLDSQF